MKRLFLPQLLASMFVAGPLAGPAHGNEVVECVVAQVNDQIITLSDVAARKKAVLDDLYRQRLPEEETQELLKRTREQLIPGLIEEQLLVQKAHNVGLAVSDDEVEQVVGSIMEQSQITDEAQLVRQLAAEGMKLSELRANIRRRTLLEKLKQFEIASKVVVTEEEAQRYYDANRDEFKQPEQVRLRQIVLLNADRPKETVQEEILELANLVRNGADFAELATLFSHAPTAEHGGDLGLVSVADLAPDVAAAASKLTPGGVSPPIESEFGFHIIKLDERKPVSYREFDEARREIGARIQQQRFDDRLKTYVEKLRNEAFVRVDEECQAQAL